MSTSSHTGLRPISPCRLQILSQRSTLQQQSCETNRASVWATRDAASRKQSSRDPHPREEGYRRQSRTRNIRCTPPIAGLLHSSIAAVLYRAAAAQLGWHARGITACRRQVAPSETLPEQ